jgi:hypothetical protein
MCNTPQNQGVGRMRKEKMHGEELLRLLDCKYQELKEIEKALVEKQKEIRELKKQCAHTYASLHVKAVDIETGVCRICRTKVE